MFYLIQFLNVDFLNALVVYLLTSSYAFIFSYIKKGDFKQATLSTMGYILLAPIVIPSLSYLFNIFSDLISKYGVSKYTLFGILQFQHWNLETIGSLYSRFFVLASIFLLLFLPIRYFFGDSIKDILTICISVPTIIIPGMITTFYFLSVIFNMINSWLITPYKHFYYANPIYLLVVAVPIVAMCMFLMVGRKA